MPLSWLVLASAASKVLRGLRAGVARELWRAWGYEWHPLVFTRSEAWVALAMLAANAVAVCWHDNTAAFRYGLGISLGGAALVICSLVGLAAGVLGGFAFMVTVGIGLYLPYVAVHTTLLKRLVAKADDRANLGFVMYLADAGGYVAYAAVLVLRDGTRAGAGSLPSFGQMAWILMVAAAVALGVMGWQMRQREGVASGGARG